MLRNYNNTLIYKLVCNDLTITDVYVGHTTHFTKRKNQHKKHCNNETDAKYNLKVYKMIRDNGGWENWTMVEVEKYPCNDSNEARARERHWYEILNANMNSCVPGRSNKDSVKAYKDANKEKIKQYREDNKEKIKQYKKDNKEKYKIKEKEYRDANREYNINRAKEYYNTNKDAINARRKELRRVKKTLEINNNSLDII